MEKTERIIICDAGPIIHLDELNCLDTLDFQRILVPISVWKEILQYRKISSENIEGLEIIETAELPLEFLEICKLYDLHKGEAAAIFLSLELKNSILFTDDGAARLFAKSKNISVHGSCPSSQSILAIKICFSFQELFHSPQKKSPQDDLHPAGVHTWFFILIRSLRHIRHFDRLNAPQAQ